MAQVVGAPDDGALVVVEDVNGHSGAQELHALTTGVTENFPLVAVDAPAKLLTFGGLVENSLISQQVKVYIKIQPKIQKQVLKGPEAVGQK